ncbi:MAG: fibronectin type III domain-containing protein, partial [Clostridia bacterium]|nr:fibronectin type III domain-containing protein [Clostridia bacterium]
MKTFNRVLSLLMIALMLAASIPFIPVSAVEEETENYALTINNTYSQSYLAENSAVGGVFFFGSSEFDGCYGNQLSGVARELYDAFVKNYVTDKKTERFSYKFKTPFDFSVEFSGSSIVMNEELEEIGLEIQYSMQAAIDAFLYDHPEVFWLRITSSSYSISASGNSFSGYKGYIEEITIIPYEIYSGASLKLSEYEAAVDSVVDSITVTESRYDTLKNIHDYICNNAWYNLVNEKRVHSSEPFFIGDGGVVCEGYSKSFKIICDRLNIPCVLVSGYAGENHMWNYVQLENGKWYLVDVTWDDQESKIYDTYFLANANTIGFDDVAISEERTERSDFSGTGVFSFTYPVLSETTYTKHVHEWESDYTVDVEPTCTKKGSKSIHCKTCEETKSVTEIPASNHANKKEYAQQNATCTEKGYTAGVYCSDCNSWIEGHEEIKSLPHDYALTVTSPTCWKEGVKTYTCFCGDSYTEAIEKIEHEYSSWQVIEKPGCTQPGVERSFCLVCDSDFEREIPASGHKVIEYVMRATTDENAAYGGDGAYVTACEICNEVFKREFFARPAEYTLSTTKYTYNGKTKTPSVTLKDSKGNTLKKDTDYTVKYESGRKLPGKYTVTVTFKGKYEGTKKLYFEIAPKATSKVTATQTTSTITLKWSKVTGADGYRVYKYNSKTKKYEKLKDVTGTSLKISKLKAGTAYKYKVRAYTKDDGTIWGDYSKVFETATKPATPKITKLTTSKGKASFTWSNVSGESGYQVYYSTKKSSGFKKVAS